MTSEHLKKIVRVATAAALIGGCGILSKAGRATDADSNDRAPLTPTATLEVGGRESGPARQITSTGDVDRNWKLSEGVGVGGNREADPSLVERLLEEARETVGDR